MFKYNEPCETTTGEIVTPYAKEGKFIACFDKSGRTVYKTAKDFLEKKQSKVIEAIPVQKEEVQPSIKEVIPEVVVVEKKEIVKQVVAEIPKKEKKPRKKKEKVEEKPKKEIKKSNIETDIIRKKDTWKDEFNLNYKDNSIEED